ncbi:hypothetical protein WN943_004933 [Citrus x changshan-huyou]
MIANVENKIKALAECSCNSWCPVNENDVNSCFPPSIGARKLKLACADIHQALDDKIKGKNLTLAFILVGAVEKGMYANGFQSPTGQDSTVDTKDFQVMVSSLIINANFSLLKATSDIPRRLDRHSLVSTEQEN